MKAIPIILLSLILFTQTACDRQKNLAEPHARIPKALFISTGNDKGIGELPSGVIIAQRFFNSRGVLFFIEPRSVLLDPGHLAGYDIIIVSTAGNYHDADRQYSLSFMSDQEMNYLSDWVAGGGVLVAGDNVGRNFLNGYDRISEFGSLNTQNWPFASLFNINLTERNMKGFRIEGDLAGGGDPGQVILETRQSDLYTLVGDSTLTSDTRVWASWTDDSTTMPAILVNAFGKGNAILLASSYFLHPANDGGFSGVIKIEEFYERILRLTLGYNPRLSLNPWPGSSGMAFVLSVKPQGEKGSMKSFSDFVDGQEIPFTAFHSADYPAAGLGKQLQEGSELASNGISEENYRDMNYASTLTAIISNENDAGISFSGFRFPFNRQSYWGLIALEDRGYHYDSSIPVDQVDEIRGAAFPYHLPVSSKGYFSTLDLIELSPMVYDDHHFFGDFNMKENPLLLHKRSLLFEKYLQRYRSEVAEPYGGIMVCIASPNYTFRNDTSSFPLNSLINTLKSDGMTWITTLDAIAARWKALEQFNFRIADGETTTSILMEAPDGLVIEDLSFELSVKPASVSSSNSKARLLEKNGRIFLVCRGEQGQRIDIIW